MKKIIQIYTDSFKGLSRESWMLAIVMLLNRAGSMVLPFLSVYMTDHLRFSYEDAGFVLSFFGIGSVLGSWLGGKLTDKFGEFHIQAISLFASIPMFLLLPHFTTVSGLATIMLVHSTICELFRPANSVAVSKYAKKEDITRSFSLNRMAVNLGFSIGPALGGVLSAISYDFLFYTNALAAGVAGVVYLLFFNKRHQQFKTDKLTQNTPTKLIKTSESPYRNIPFLKFCLLSLVFSICFFQLLNTLPQFYKMEVKLSQENIGYLLGWSGLIVVLLEMLVINIAERRFTIKTSMLIGTIICGISYGMIGVNYHLGMLFVSISLLSLGEILVLPYMSTITAMAASKDRQGEYMGMNGMAVAISFIISPILGTKIATIYGFSTLWIGTAMIMVLVAIGFYFNIKKLQLNNKTMSTHH